MANPLKVLTQLSASKEAQFADVVEMQKTVTVSGAEAHLRVTGGGEISGSGALKAAGAAQLGSSLDVKGASALSGALGVVGAASLQSTLGVSGVATFSSDMSASAGLDVAGAAHVAGAADFDSTVNVDGVASFQSAISGAAGFDLVGAARIGGAAQFDSNASIAGTLGVTGDITAQASASIAGDLDVNGKADIAGNLDVHGNAVVYGNLEVKGTTTTIESTTVTVADANIQLATVASPTDSTADGAGITILGASNKTFQWNNDGHGFTSSENMNLASGKVYKIDGQEVLSKDGSSAKLSFDGGAASLSVSSNSVSMAGDLDLTNDLHVSGTLVVDQLATFASDVTASNNLHVSNDQRVVGELVVATDIITPIALSEAVFVRADVLGTPGQMFFSADFSQVSASVDINAGAALNVNGIATFASDITASANVDVAGTAHIVGDATLDNNLNVGYSVSIGGTYKVNGNTILENGGQATRLFNAGGTGVIAIQDNGSEIYVGGVSAITLANDVSASAGLDVAGAAHIAGEVVIDSDLKMQSSAVRANAVHSDGIYARSDFMDNSAVPYVAMEVNGLTSNVPLTVNNNAQITGALDVDGTLNIDGTAAFQSGVEIFSTLDVNSDAAFDTNLSIGAALNLSGSAFTNITTPVVAGKYNVNDAIRALDAKAGQQASDINNNYNALRYLAAANFDAQGMAAFTSSFAAAAIEQVSVDVLVQAGGSGPWTNDLVSVQVKAAGAYVGFEISAPAMGASDKVRIIAVKESGSLA